MKDRIQRLIEEVENELINLSEYIYNNPELGYEEYKSSRAHIDLLKKYNFIVEEKYIGIDTAFKAEYKGQKEGPTIAYLTEYDALPGIGHGCGHNLLGTVSTGAGIVLSKLIDELGGRVLVFGTPAEETSGAKVIMAEKGSFNDVDVAMMAHPNDTFCESGKSLALEPIQFTFRGKTAHAASAPEKGINALDGVLLTFNGVNALREHILPTARIHGVIIEGGKAANIVPDLAIAQFYIRATTKEYLIELSEKVKNCAKAASLATGTKLEITNYEASYDNLVTNQVLSSRFTQNLKIFGVENCEKPRDTFGSLDMGNVSHVCPAIHPYFAITEGKTIAAHTTEFAEATLTDIAYKNMAKTIGALVLTGIDVIRDKQLLKDIKDEFNK
ncbi:M20 family metallopeptidase [Schnuerera ultunensis]|uniref:Peptidase M20 domain-containing protein 2 n=1 Tax=[Clostridium] ultunense Esp TaxID=1288971 RepID=A0A1M4PMA5_9FIRM|nr:M20 family metallopeptidase [Schnuerera ultunensis]SHD76592.1 Amidohydrolase [[Clostridium] ultunense Esp]